MTTSAPLRLLIAAAASVCVGVGVSYAFAVRAARSPATAWEYHCVLPPGAVGASEEGSAPRTAHDLKHHGADSGDHPSERVLNHLGRQGWELVAIDPTNHHYCFKRPLPQ